VQAAKSARTAKTVKTATAKSAKIATTRKAGATAANGKLPFFGREWAQAAKAAINAGPDAAARAKKIERFWEWIEKAKQHVNCRLALVVSGMPASGGRNTLLLDLEAGRCVRARLATRDDAEASATYVLVGGFDDWRQIMAGFDMGKAVMYRKLLLEKGEVLVFFKSIYYWTESLACLQRIPTAFPATAARVH
jgi:hypothetical protein